jgi:hypothetical protein
MQENPEVVGEGPRRPRFDIRSYFTDPIGQLRKFALDPEPNRELVSPYESETPTEILSPASSPSVVASSPHVQRSASPHSRKISQPRKLRSDSIVATLDPVSSSPPPPAGLPVQPPSPPMAGPRFKPIWRRKQGEIVIIGQVSRDEYDRLTKQERGMYLSHEHLDFMEGTRKHDENRRSAALNIMQQQLKVLEGEVGNLQPDGARALSVLKQAMNTLHYSNW